MPPLDVLLCLSLFLSCASTAPAINSGNLSVLKVDDTETRNEELRRLENEKSVEHKEIDILKNLFLYINSHIGDNSFGANLKCENSKGEKGDFVFYKIKGKLFPNRRPIYLAGTQLAVGFNKYFEISAEKKLFRLTSSHIMLNNSQNVPHTSFIKLKTEPNNTNYHVQVLSSTTKSVFLFNDTVEEIASTGVTKTSVSQLENLNVTHFGYVQQELDKNNSQKFHFSPENEYEKFTIPYDSKTLSIKSPEISMRDQSGNDSKYDNSSFKIYKYVTEMENTLYSTGNKSSRLDSISTTDKCCGESLSSATTSNVQLSNLTQNINNTDNMSTYTEATEDNKLNHTPVSYVNVSTSLDNKSEKDSNIPDNGITSSPSLGNTMDKEVIQNHFHSEIVRTSPTRLDQLTTYYESSNSETMFDLVDVISKHDFTTFNNSVKKDHLSSNTTFNLNPGNFTTERYLLIDYIQPNKLSTVANASFSYIFGIDKKTNSSSKTITGSDLKYESNKDSTLSTPPDNIRASKPVIVKDYSILHYNTMPTEKGKFEEPTFIPSTSSFSPHKSYTEFESSSKYLQESTQNNKLEYNPIQNHKSEPITTKNYYTSSSSVNETRISQYLTSTRKITGVNDLMDPSTSEQSVSSQRMSEDKLYKGLTNSSLNNFSRETFNTDLYNSRFFNITPPTHEILSISNHSKDIFNNSEFEPSYRYSSSNRMMNTNFTTKQYLNTDTDSNKTYKTERNYSIVLSTVALLDNLTIYPYENVHSDRPEGEKIQIFDNSNATTLPLIYDYTNNIKNTENFTNEKIFITSSLGKVMSGSQVVKLSVPQTNATASMPLTTVTPSIPTSASDSILLANATGDIPLAIETTHIPLTTGFSSISTTASNRTPLTTSASSSPLPSATTSIPLTSATDDTPLTNAATSISLTTAFSSITMTARDSIQLTAAAASNPMMTATGRIPLKTATTSIPLTTEFSSIPTTASNNNPLKSSTTSVPSASATTSIPLASATTSVPLDSATSSIPLASATTSIPSASATTSIPSASATGSIPLAITSTPPTTTTTSILTTTANNISLATATASISYPTVSASIPLTTAIHNPFPSFNANSIALATTTSIPPNTTTTSIQVSTTDSISLKTTGISIQLTDINRVPLPSTNASNPLTTATSNMPSMMATASIPLATATTRIPLTSTNTNTPKTTDNGISLTTPSTSIPSPTVSASIPLPTANASILVATTTTTSIPPTTATTSIPLTITTRFPLPSTNASNPLTTATTNIPSMMATASIPLASTTTRIPLTSTNTNTPKTTNNGISLTTATTNISSPTASASRPLTTTTRFPLPSTNASNPLTTATFDIPSTKAAASVSLMTANSNISLTIANASYPLASTTTSIPPTIATTNIQLSTIFTSIPLTDTTPSMHISTADDSLNDKLNNHNWIEELDTRTYEKTNTKIYNSTPIPNNSVENNSLNYSLDPLTSSSVKYFGFTYSKGESSSQSRVSGHKINGDRTTTNEKENVSSADALKYDTNSTFYPRWKDSSTVEPVSSWFGSVNITNVVTIASDDLHHSDTPKHLETKPNRPSIDHVIKPKTENSTSINPLISANNTSNHPIISLFKTVHPTTPLFVSPEGYLDEITTPQPNTVYTMNNIDVITGEDDTEKPLITSSDTGTSFLDYKSKFSPGKKNENPFNINYLTTSIGSNINVDEMQTLTPKLNSSDLNTKHFQNSTTSGIYNGRHTEVTTTEIRYHRSSKNQFDIEASTQRSANANTYSNEGDLVIAHSSKKSDYMYTETSETVNITENTSATIVEKTEDIFKTPTKSVTPILIPNKSDDKNIKSSMKKITTSDERTSSADSRIGSSTVETGIDFEMSTQLYETLEPFNNFTFLLPTTDYLTSYLPVRIHPLIVFNEIK